MSYRLSDEVIGEVAKLIQVAILTGTDVIDNLRTVRVIADSDNSEVSLDVDYKAQSQKNIERQLQLSLGTKVRIHAQRKRGKIIIEYYSPQDLDRLLKILKK